MPRVISPLRATATIGAGTLVTLTMSVVVAKFLALLVGPEGVGRYGLLHSVLGIAVIVTGLGVNTAIVREIAAALGHADAARVAAFRRAGLVVVAIAGLVGVGALLVLREPFAAFAFGSDRTAFDIVLLAPAVFFQLVAGWELGVLNGHHRVRSLTLAAAGASAFGAALTLILVAALGEGGIALSVLTSTLVALIVASIVRSRDLGRAPAVPTDALREAARRLVRFGGPYTASQLAGTGSQLLVPIIILGTVGIDGVGHFRAATSISIAYLAFLLNAMAQDYLPRAAAASDEELLLVIERQTRIVVAIAAPAILAMLAIGPFAVSILYSDEFQPAVRALQWQLVGDFLKLPAWALSFILLARASLTRFLGLELIGGIVLLLAVITLTPTMGLVGAGIAFVITYGVYYLAAWILVRSIAHVVVGRVQLTVIGLGVGCAGVLFVMPDANSLRGLVFGVAALVVASVAWPILLRHHRGGELL